MYPSRRTIAAAILTAHPTTTDALAALLGCEGEWSTAEEPPAADVAEAAAELLTTHPDTAKAVVALIGN